MHWITIVGIILITAGTIMTYFGQNIRNKSDIVGLNNSINEKNCQIDELVRGKNELLEKVEIYQQDLREKEKQIEALENKAKMAARGITSIYAFNGARRQTHGGNINVQLGPELDAFKQMTILQQSKDHPGLIALCEKQITKTPDWLTPYLYMGVAQANIGLKEEAIENLRHVVEIAGEDPEYKQAEELLARLGEK